MSLASKMPNRLKHWINKPMNWIRIWSIKAAVREQRLSPLYNQLAAIVPDITHQYSSFEVNTEHLIINVRALHSFQVALINKALGYMENKDVTVVDIGDSSGTHLQYLNELNKDRSFRCLSVNTDEEAVKRIQQKGMEAICTRAEDLASYSIDADIFLSFEMLEHLMNPSVFLRSLSVKTNCKAFVITVPYLSHSRVGLHHIRHGQRRNVSAENTHIFELSPKDWELVFKHSGWAVVSNRIYYQYPRMSPFGFILKKFWKWSDFEGFYGAILKPDQSWSDLYSGWNDKS